MDALGGAEPTGLVWPGAVPLSRGETLKKHGPVSRQVFNSRLWRRPPCCHWNKFQ